MKWLYDSSARNGLGKKVADHRCRKVEKYTIYERRVTLNAARKISPAGCQPEAYFPECVDESPTKEYARSLSPGLKINLEGSRAVV